LTGEPTKSHSNIRTRLSHFNLTRKKKQKSSLPSNVPKISKEIHHTISASSRTQNSPMHFNKLTLACATYYNSMKMYSQMNYLKAYHPREW